MKNKKILAVFASATLVATGVANAQTQGQPLPPEGGRPPMPGQMREMREEMRENRQEFREDRRDAREEFRGDMQDRKEWMNSSTTATGTKPTPWKNLKENYKEAREEMKEKMKGMRDEMRDMMHPRMASLTDAQAQAISSKLGITSEALKAELASGTKLKELIKDKIKPEEMRQILPPQVATFTRPIEEKGFFNNLRSRIFGQRQEMIKEEMNEFGEIVVSTSTDPRPKPFWRRFFNF